MASRVMGTPERRRSPRAAQPVPLAIRDAKLDLRTETKNLSAAGAYCTLDRFIPPMSKLQLTFELPGSFRRTHIRCTAVVVRVEPIVKDPTAMRYNTALFFTEISKPGRAAISRFVRQRLSARRLTA